MQLSFYKAIAIYVKEKKKKNNHQHLDIRCTFYIFIPPIPRDISI